MTAMPVDYQADVLRVDLAHEGYSRVILLGTEAEMAPGGLRTALAKWGVQVLIPPEAERPWISSLSDSSGPYALSEDIARLLSLHDALPICNLGVPTVAYSSRGSVVPIRNVVFDMGGVLFEWDPLAMARRVCETEEDATLLARAVFGSPEWVWQDAGAVDDKTVAWTAKTRVPSFEKRGCRPLCGSTMDRRSCASMAVGPQ